LSLTGPAAKAAEPPSASGIVTSIAIIVFFTLFPFLASHLRLAITYFADIIMSELVK
jgi:hypothetical protein